MTQTFAPADRLMMTRALQLARNGALHASPNPMVGCVIAAPGGRVIGEGWHRRCGEGHAEVNAVASVAEADRPLLAQSTVYVTLEPCSHYGKTPPCAKLLIDSGVKRVVVATADPFEKVSGRGLAMLRDAGIEVQTGLMADEARALNARFFTAHTLRRPYVTLKWAQSSDGYIDGREHPADSAAAISTPLNAASVHRLRALHDAILIGSGTYLADSPSLTVRYFAGESPRRLVADRSGRIGDAEGWEVRREADLHTLLSDLYAEGVTSLLVEGGRTLLQEFLDAGLYDDIRVEVAPEITLGVRGTLTRAPFDGHIIYNLHQQNHTCKTT